jgi:type IV pilus assembly protein PilV
MIALDGFTMELAMSFRSRGFSMLEVLITLVILAFGLLALINLQIKLQMNEVESYQRGQALMLLNDMAARLQAHPLSPLLTSGDVERLQDYLTGESWVGVDGLSCADDFVQAADDCAGWDELLEGAAVEQSGGGNAGAMAGARGCVTQVQEADLGFGVCRPPIYRISVSWQGLYKSAAPAVDCAADQYGDEGYRRTVSTLVVVGSPRCL